MNSTTVKDLPQFVRDMMSSPPPSGEGFHNWLFRMARVLHPYRSENDIYGVLESATHTCGRRVSSKEINDAIRNSKAFAWNPNNQYPVVRLEKKWPSRNQERIEAITADGIGLADLWEISPVRIEENESNTEEFIDLLFPNNPLLCVGLNQSEFNTLHREEWRGKLAVHQLIVPSPMSKVRGLKQDGTGESEHTLDNTGPRRFLIVEFDKGDFDQHAAILHHLGSFAPLVMAVHSGGKSLHGWFYAYGQSEGVLLRFMRYAVSLGADPATWTRCQFVRLPDGKRDNGKRQSVMFFNPSIIGGRR